MLEEAALIQELIERFDWSQRTIGERIGRDVSWINRRLALLSSLPEAVLTALRGGHLSSWAASRVMVPLGARQHRSCHDVTGRVTARTVIEPGTEPLV